MSDEPIRIGHSDDTGATAAPPHSATCDCCVGTRVATVAPITNRPNLSEIAYRSGDHGRFKASMLAGLSSADRPGLAALGTRADDDLSIALIDAWASALEVLSFYQERHANEAYLQTARERLSIGEISRLIGYRLHPGAAAETHLVFTMDDPPGAVPDIAELTVPAGTRVQSQPGPDESPVVFETLDDLHARVGWNEFKARTSRPAPVRQGATSTWLSGQATGLSVGDAIAVVGRERSDPSFADFDPASPHWAFRRLTSVEPSADRDATRVGWNEPLGDLGDAGARVFAFGARAALFGHNAPHPKVLSPDQREAFGIDDGGPIDDFGTVVLARAAGAEVGTGGIAAPGGTTLSSGFGIPDWKFGALTTSLPLDSIQQGFVAGAWIVVTLPRSSTHPTGLTQLYQVEAVSEDASAKYALSGKHTTLTLTDSADLDLLATFDNQYRRIAVHGASRELSVVDEPVIERIEGDSVELSTLVTDLPEGRTLAVVGPRAQLLVQSDDLGIQPDEGPIRPLLRGNRVTLLAKPTLRSSFGGFFPFGGFGSFSAAGLAGPFGGGPLTPFGALVFAAFAAASGPPVFVWRVRDADGFEGEIEAPAGELESIAADDDVEVVAQIVDADRVEASDLTHSRLHLADALDAVYDRAGVTIAANVATASHGESVTEILGAGNPAIAFESFAIGQGPITHLIAPTESGVRSTLEVRVDGVLWNESADLYERGADARTFATSLDDNGTTTVRFGDGLSGARPGAGRDNIIAEARVGLGRDGNVRTGQLGTALDQPLGLREVTNPVAATGGADPEDRDAARTNAPIRTLTLGRLVSITDYRDLALGYPGVATADARWVWNGETREIVVTIAGTGGEVIERDGPIHAALLQAYRDLGDPFVQFVLVAHEPVEFHVGLRVAVDPAYDSAMVLDAVEQELRMAFSFERRGFAEPVVRSDVAAAAHTVAGVVAIDTDLLYRAVAPQSTPSLYDRLVARPGRNEDGVRRGAEILTLSAGPLDKIEVM